MITGTDTGVGKTTVACALALLGREAGLKVGVVKPVETGCGPDLVAADGLKLAKAAGVAVDDEEVEGAWTRQSIDEVVPWRFADPLAPEEAAKRAGTEISVDRIFQVVDRWTEKAELLLVESAGGLMVPINPRFTFADLLQGLEMPALLVAANRLGAINHALLTLEALRRRDITPIAVVLNNPGPSPDASASSNADIIRKHGQVNVIETPYAGNADPATAVAVALRPALAGIMRAMEADWWRIAVRYMNAKRKTDRQGGNNGT